ncbi:glycoside hydrolase family 9 protein [Clostridium saccharoperbutylacetonicum]
MKSKKIIALMSAVVICAGMITSYSGFQTKAEASELNVNLITNGNFDTDLAGWGNFTTNGGEGEVTFEDGELKAQVNNCGDEQYSMQVYYDGFKMYKNAKYRLEFDVSSTINRTIDYRIQLNGGDYRSYVDGQVKISKDVQTVSKEFTMTEKNDPSPRLAFNIGKVAGETPEAHSIKIDNVKLILLDDTGADMQDEKPKVEQKIVLNQVGYKPDDKKKVVFRAETKDRKFRVVSTATKEVVYEGEITGLAYDNAAKETDCFGDFSSVNTPGTYRIETDSLGSSFEFTIGKDVYNNLFKDAVRFFYMQRCGQDLPEELAGKWAHPTCHTDLARIYGTDKKIDVSGGWHDAGDYGRYVVASSKAIADLLSAYRDNKEVFGDDFNIPESGNGIPDVLDEVKYQLQWMLKMQEPASGGVYHKVTCANFPGQIMPQYEKEELIVCPISTTATADFAAIMAMGYENFKDIDASLAEKCLAAGENAWTYLEKTPNSVVKNPKGISTGEYGDTDDSDERYWAAAELFKATGDSKYDEAFRKMANSKIQAGYDWSRVGHYGNMAYLSAKGADQNVSNNIKNYIINEAQDIVALDKNDNYNVSNGTDYYWGSNMQVTNNAVLLAEAYKIIPNKEYLEYAKEHINYCLGKNSLGMSYVTGYGSDYVKHPHHRPSTAQGEAVPGMIAGGPNKNLEDPLAKNLLKDKAPAKCYLDNSESYSTNEVDIYWNSPFVHAMAELNMK